MDSENSAKAPDSSANEINVINESQSVNPVPETGSVVNPIQENVADGVASPVVTPSTETVTKASPSTVIADNNKKKNKKPLLVVAIILAVLFLLGGSGAAFIGFVYLKPENVWSRSLARTNKTFESINEGINKYAESGVHQTGKLDVTGAIELDGSLEGKSKGNNGYVKADLGASGVRLGLEVRTIEAENSDLPDVYMQVTGLDGLGELLGGTSSDYGELANQFNDQWYFLDHTLFEQSLNEGVKLTNDDIKAIKDAVLKANRDYLFSVEDGKAVLEIRKKYGREKFDGLNTLKFRVGINKEGLKGYVTALKDNLKETKLKDYAPEGQSFEEWVGFDGIINNIDEMDFSKSEDEADVWVDEYRSFIRNIRFSESGDVDENNTVTLDLGFPYKGGDEYPFVMSLYGKENGDDVSGDFSAIYNAKSGELKLTIDGELTTDGQKSTLTANLTSTPSDEEVKIEKPDDAKNLMELIGDAYGSYLGNFSDPYSSAASGYGTVGLAESQAKARDTLRILEINTLHAKLEEFYNDNNYYPQTFTSSTFTGIDIESLYDSSDEFISIGSPAGTVTAAKSIPQPANSEYWYVPVACGGGECQSYVLSSYIEVPSSTKPNPYTKTSLN